MGTTVDERSGIEACDLVALHRAHFGRLWQVAVMLTGDRAAAEDLVQDAFALLLRAQRRRGGPAAGAELAYLRSTVVNLSASRWRRLAVARRHVPTITASARTDAQSADEDAAARSRGAAVRAAVLALPDRQRAAVVLHYFEGLTDAEVAAELGVSVGTVKSHLHRARASLALMLEDPR
jgi:RNA polymerase sigma-70 factor (sigma-E family)